MTPTTENQQDYSIEYDGDRVWFRCHCGGVILKMALSKFRNGITTYDPWPGNDLLEPSFYEPLPIWKNDCSRCHIAYEFTIDSFQHLMHVEKMPLICAQIFQRLLEKFGLQPDEVSVRPKPITDLRQRWSESSFRLVCQCGEHIAYLAEDPSLIVGSRISKTGRLEPLDALIHAPYELASIPAHYLSYQLCMRLKEYTKFSAINDFFVDLRGWCPKCHIEHRLSVQYRKELLLRWIEESEARKKSRKTT